MFKVKHFFVRLPHGVLPKVCRVVPRHSVAITTCASPRSMPLCPASRAVVAPDRNVATRHCVGAPTRPPYTRPGAPPHVRHGWRDSRTDGHCHAPTAPAPPGRLTPSRYTAPIPATRPPGRPPSVGLPPHTLIQLLVNIPTDCRLQYQRLVILLDSCFRRND